MAHLNRPVRYIKTTSVLKVLECLMQILLFMITSLNLHQFCIKQSFQQKLL